MLRCGHFGIWSKKLEGAGRCAVHFGTNFYDMFSQCPLLDQTLGGPFTHIIFTKFNHIYDFVNFVLCRT